MAEDQGYIKGGESLIMRGLVVTIAPGRILSSLAARFSFSGYYTILYTCQPALLCFQASDILFGFLLIHLAEFYSSLLVTSDAVPRWKGNHPEWVGAYA